MESERFDRLIRRVGGHLNRRAALGPMTGVGLGILGAFATDAEAGNRKRKRKRIARRRRRKRANVGVRYFEDLAESLEQAGGDCNALTDAAEAFRGQHEALLAQIQDEEAQWSPQQRTRRARRGQQRITAAAERLHTLLGTCNFRGTSPTSDSLLCGRDLTGSDPADPLAAEACGGGCDCQCICPLTPGECAGAFFGCLFGGKASASNCCWFGTCVNHLCMEQCTNCCAIPV